MSGVGWVGMEEREGLLSAALHSRVGRSCCARTCQPMKSTTLDLMRKVFGQVSQRLPGMSFLTASFVDCPIWESGDGCGRHPDIGSDRQEETRLRAFSSTGQERSVHERGSRLRGTLLELKPRAQHHGGPLGSARAGTRLPARQMAIRSMGFLQ